MGYALQDFCRDTTAILKTGSSRQHVDKVKAHMERLLVDTDFVKQYFNDELQRIVGRQTGAPTAVS